MFLSKHVGVKNASFMKTQHKKKFIKKKKNGQAYFVEWDSDASSDDDDDKPSKGVVGIAIKEAPSLFSTPHCLMAKGGAKVNYKSGGRHWVLDSGCTQHMTGDPKMFSSLDDNVVGYSVSSLVTIAEARSKELVQLLSQMITLSQMCC